MKNSTVGPVRHWVIVTAIAALALGCSTQPTTGARGGAAPEATQVARSDKGMVVTSSILATAVGVQILESGGNAIDAAAAAGFALSVVEPSMSGIGGRAQWLIHSKDGESYGIDGTTQVPAGYPVDDVSAEGLSSGYGMIGIPGVVAAHTKALREHGSLPLDEVMAPAIALAEHGFVLGSAEAERIASTADLLGRYGGSRQHFLKPDGSPYVGGERFVQPALARTLRAIAREGSDVFYQGSIAMRIAADMEANGGYVTATDLADYRALPSKVVRGSYRDYGLVATWLPAAGATTIEILQILEHFDLSAMTSAEWAGTVGLALRLGFEDFEWSWTAGVDAASVLVSKEQAAKRAREVRLPVKPVSPADVDPPLREHDANTTHLSVVDRDGRAVALTQTIGPTMGSKVVTADLGFVYAATMGYLGRTPPGVRAVSAISPLVLLKNRRPVYVMGAAGARRIITAIVETVSRAVDQGLPFDEAMAAPRLHPSGGVLVLEDRGDTTWTEDHVAKFEEWGLGIRKNSSSSYFGRIHGIHIDTQTGQLTGVADPRRDGAAAAPRR